MDKLRSSDSKNTAIRGKVLQLLASPDDPDDVMYMSDRDDAADSDGE